MCPIHRIHAHGDPGESGILERAGKAGQQMAVGRDREIQRVALTFPGVRSTAKPGTESRQVRHHARQDSCAEAVHRRSGAPFRCPGQRTPDHAQVFFDRQLGELRAVGAGAAVDATVVAAIRHRDAQIGNSASEFIPKTRRRAGAERALRLPGPPKGANGISQNSRHFFESQDRGSGDNGAIAILYIKLS